MNKRGRQHEPLRVPNGWEGQERALVIQLENLLNNIYSLISETENALKDLNERVKALEEEE